MKLIKNLLNNMINCKRKKIKMNKILNKLSLKFFKYEGFIFF